MVFHSLPESRINRDLILFHSLPESLRVTLPGVTLKWVRKTAWYRSWEELQASNLSIIIRSYYLLASFEVYLCMWNQFEILLVKKFTIGSLSLSNEDCWLRMWSSLVYNFSCSRCEIVNLGRLLEINLIEKIVNTNSGNTIFSMHVPWSSTAQSYLCPSQLLPNNFY